MNKSSANRGKYESPKYSIASKRRWKDIPKEERSKIMSERAKQRWAKLSPSERAKMIQKMVDGQRCKKSG